MGNAILSRCVLSLFPTCLAFSMSGCAGLAILLEVDLIGGGRDVFIIEAAIPSRWVLSLFSIARFMSD